MDCQSLNIHLSPLTSRFLEDAFILKNDSAQQEYFLPPNGSVGLYIVTDGEGFHVIQNQLKKWSPVFVHGLYKQHRNRLSQGYKAIGFRFKPEFMQLVLNESGNAFRDQSIGLDEIISKNKVEKLQQEVLNAKNDFQVIQAFNSFLQNNLVSYNIDSRINYSLNKIRKGEVNNIEDLSKEVNISSRALRTLFQKHVGISAKELVKIYRLQKVMQLGLLDEGSLTSLAYKIGYFDQSHFIHEFKSTIGISPLKYFSNNNLTSDFYNFQRLRLDSFAVNECHLIYSGIKQTLPVFD